VVSPPSPGVASFPRSSVFGVGGRSSLRRMEAPHGKPDEGRGNLRGLQDLIEAGVLIPATRRMTEVLDCRPPLKIEGEQASMPTLDEQRAERA
jgi:hypothetical protein